MLKYEKAFSSPNVAKYYISDRGWVLFQVTGIDELDVYSQCLHRLEVLKIDKHSVNWGE